MGAGRESLGLHRLRNWEGVGFSGTSVPLHELDDKAGNSLESSRQGERWWDLAPIPFPPGHLSLERDRRSELKAPGGGEGVCGSLWSKYHLISQPPLSLLDVRKDLCFLPSPGQPAILGEPLPLGVSPVPITGLADAARLKNATR